MQLKVLALLSLVLLLLGVALASPSEVSAQGASQCDQDPFCKVFPGSNSGEVSTPNGETITVFIIKAGSGDGSEHPFGQGSFNDGCYRGTVNGDTATWEKYGEGSSCKDVSHIQLWYSTIPPYEVCSETTDWVLVDESEWADNGDGTESRTFSYVKYDARDNETVCDEKTETETRPVDTTICEFVTAWVLVTTSEWSDNGDGTESRILTYVRHDLLNNEVECGSKTETETRPVGPSVCELVTDWVLVSTTEWVDNGDGTESRTLTYVKYDARDNETVCNEKTETETLRRDEPPICDDPEEKCPEIDPRFVCVTYTGAPVARLYTSAGEFIPQGNRWWQVYNPENSEIRIEFPDGHLRRELMTADLESGEQIQIQMWAGFGAIYNEGQPDEWRQNGCYRIDAIPQGVNEGDYINFADLPRPPDC